MVTHPYAEFLAWLEAQGWSNFGRASLAQKLKTTESTVFRAIRGNELQPRTKYHLWKITGEVLECFRVEATPLQVWLYDHEMTENEFADMIGLPRGAVKHYVYGDGKPPAENAAILYQHTGLETYAPVEDPAIATARYIQEQRTSGSAGTVAERGTEDSTRPQITERPRPTVRERQLPRLTAKNSPSRSVLEGLLTEILDLLAVRSENEGNPFEKVVAVLRQLRDADQAERDAFIESIGNARFRYWVGMLTAMSDEKEFKIWHDMSDHSLGG